MHCAFMQLVSASQINNMWLTPSPARRATGLARRRRRRRQRSGLAGLGQRHVAHPHQAVLLHPPTLVLVHHLQQSKSSSISAILVFGLKF
jgi:hypothetical protein